MHVQTSTLAKLSMGFGGYTCNWGVHMCGLYETDAEYEDLVYRFLHQGDLDGDRVRFFHREATPDRFVREYARRFPDEADHPLDHDRFTLLSSRQRCFPDGRFEPLAQDPKLRALRESAAAGPGPIRGAADMDWVLEGIPGSELLLPYEARLNPILDGVPAVMTCIYDLRKFPGSTIMGVLRTHRFAITRGMIVENPYYDPAKVLREHGVEWPPILSEC
jgi:hypothetical protein